VTVKPAARACLAFFALGCGRSGLDAASSGGSAGDDASVAIDAAAADVTSSDDDASVRDAAEESPADAPPDRAPICGPVSCENGCCSNGKCLRGSENTSCGFGGQACVDCTSFGWYCETFDVGNPSSDACVSPDAGGLFSGDCNWVNCLGCCQGNVCIHTSNLPETCGSHGQPCVTCTGPFERCMLTGPFAEGQCVGSGPCNPTNCSGCCDASGACVDPVALGLCGTSGVACRKCTPDQVCRYGQCE
jgi:hypothetical protein